jgi:magnesium chelatase family protein
MRQAERFKHTRLLTNADMGPAEVRRHCQLDGAGQRLMQAAMRQLHLSARAYHRVLKLARTIADLAGVESIAASHVAEAIGYRRRLELAG